MIVHVQAEPPGEGSVVAVARGWLLVAEGDQVLHSGGAGISVSEFPFVRGTHAGQDAVLWHGRRSACAGFP